MNCPQCRAVLPAGAQFCPSCGYRFPAQAPQPAAYGQPAAPQQAAPAYGQQPAAYPPQPPQAGYPPQYGQQPQPPPAAPPAYAPPQPPQQQAYAQPQPQQAPQPYGQQPQAPQPYGQQPQAPQPYGQQPQAPYGQQPPANPYGQPQAPQQAYGQPQPPANPYGQPQNPYGQPQPGQQVFSAIDQQANAAYGAVAGAFGQPMAMATPQGVPSIDEICARGYQVQIGKWIGEGWQLCKPILWIMIGYMFVTGVISNVTFGLSYLIYGPLMAGLTIVPLRLAKGRPQPFGAFFHGFKAFVPLWLLSIVSMFLVGVGYVLLIIPGMYLFIAWTWAQLLVIDRGMDFWPAMAASMKVVNKNFWGTFGWLFVSGLVAMLGMVACGVGLLFTVPWWYCMQVIAYRDIFGLNPGMDRCGG